MSVASSLLSGLLLGLAAAAFAAAPESPPPTPSPADGPVASPPARTASPAVPIEAPRHLPNLHRLPGEILSGGLPADEAAFRELQQLGVRTIISVDGAPPNVALAERFGMRYVHLPIGYDGVPPQRVPALAHAVATLPRPIYFHCHHGKHRSPAAAVVACIATGHIAPEAAEATLEQMGTDPHYVGLYRAARRATPLSPEQLTETAPPLPSSVPPPPLVDVMLEIEQLRDRLGDQVTAFDADSADRAAAADSRYSEGARLTLLLKEQLIEMQRLQTDTAISKQDVPVWNASLTRSIRHAEALETAWHDAATSGDPSPLQLRWRRVQNDCRGCHRRFRDPPR